MEARLKITTGYAFKNLKWNTSPSSSLYQPITDRLQSKGLQQREGIKAVNHRAGTVRIGGLHTQRGYIVKDLFGVEYNG
ncbi:jg15525 [Pararge aegeria aegeria]|uniref:Jg15525 protein n=1 Tax=Pararge aegeria aegeria TaxID=348720 RepID=A0A8S4SF03_9NEOP|nr:jg15525 [Pararge aegeria aegeria]